MEQYKKAIIKRLCMIGFAFALSIALLLLSRSGAVKALGNEEFMYMLESFELGILIGADITLAQLVIKYIRALRDEIKLKKLYFEENDERMRMIREKTGGNFTFVCVFIIMFSGIIGGFFNEIIFFSLIGCSMFLLTAKCMLKFYYLSKY